MVRDNNYTEDLQDFFERHGALIDDQTVVAPRHGFQKH